MMMQILTNDVVANKRLVSALLNNYYIIDVLPRESDPTEIIDSKNVILISDQIDYQITLKDQLYNLKNKSYRLFYYDKQNNIESIIIDEYLEPLRLFIQFESSKKEHFKDNRTFMFNQKLWLSINLNCSMIDKINKESYVLKQNELHKLYITLSEYMFNNNSLNDNTLINFKNIINNLIVKEEE